MTVVCECNDYYLKDKVDILKQESELLRSIRDKLTETNNSLQSDNIQLTLSKKNLEFQQAVCLYKAQKLKFKVACHEAEKLSSTMFEDIFTLDTEILSTNEALLLRLYKISEYERKQYASAVKRLSIALQESVAECKHMESLVKVFEEKSMASSAQIHSHNEQLLSEKAKFKEFLKSSKDKMKEMQSMDSKRKERICELEIEVNRLKEQLHNFLENKLELKLRESEEQLQKSINENKALQRQVDDLHADSEENVKLQEKLKRYKATHSRALDYSIAGIKSVIVNCDETLNNDRLLRPKDHTSTSKANNSQQKEDIFSQIENYEVDDQSDNSEKASKFKDPNWSDIDHVSGRKNKKVPKKRKQQPPIEVDLIPAAKVQTKTNQPRKLFAERAKSKMFTNSPGLSSVDHPFTDMLQISGSVASLKDKSKRSRTRSSQKLENSPV